jgi:hypothetical protein
MATCGVGGVQVRFMGHIWWGNGKISGGAKGVSSQSAAVGEDSVVVFKVQ